MSDRILGRLHEMDISITSQPDLIDILSLYAKEDDADESEVLRLVLEALNIGGSPSLHALPRPSGPRHI
jgi:hypothetical protein